MRFSKQNHQMLKKIIAIALGLICFHLLFWQEQFGLNLVLFYSLLMLLAGLFSPAIIWRKELLICLAAFLLSAVFYLLHHSILAGFVLLLSTLISLMFIKQKNLKTVYDGLMASAYTYFSQIGFLWKSMQSFQVKNPRWSIFIQGSKLLFIPLILAFVFFQLYRNANPRFEELSLGFLAFFFELFESWSLAWIVFIGFGFSLLLWVSLQLTCSELPLFSERTKLIRKRKKRSYKLAKGESLLGPIRNEYRIALLTFGLLNLLLLIVNWLDLNWIYWNFEVPENFNLKQFVHEGTWVFLLSIFISIGLVLYFFRGSLHFYPNNRWLKVLAKVWIAQNVFLMLSVFLRNFHYINYHGLATKRLGMIAFLSMTLFGLLTLWIKVSKEKNAYFLIKSNTWFIFFCLLGMSSFHWDRFILNYNLNHSNPAEIDIDHYLSLDPVLVPEIIEALPKIEKQMEAHKKNKIIWVEHLDIQKFEKKLMNRASYYKDLIEPFHWQAWNWNDNQFLKREKLNPTSQ